LFLCEREIIGELLVTLSRPFPECSQQGTTAMGYLPHHFAVASGAANTVDFATADRTAKNGFKYTADSGTLISAPGDRTQAIVAPVFE
jgi:hypothetical protein